MADKPIMRDPMDSEEAKAMESGKYNSHVSFVCVLCNESFVGWGNNPDPLAKEGVCCDQCDMDKVIPKRIEEHNNGRKI